MPTLVAGSNSAVVTQMYLALYGQAPSSTLYNTYISQVAANGSTAFATSLAANFAGVSNAALATQVLSNMGVNASTVTALEPDGVTPKLTTLTDAMVMFFGAYPTLRGAVILNLTNILATLTTDSTYSTAANAFNTQAYNNYTSASAGGAANTISVVGEVDTLPYAMIAGHSYRIEVQAAAASALNPEIYQVLDPTSTVIPNAANQDYGTSINAQLTLLPTVSGNYNVKVKGQNNTTGEYVVLVTDLSTVTTDATPVTITAGQSYADSVSQSFQTKRVFFSLTGGQEYRFALNSATSGDTLNAPVLRGIYDDAGKLVPGTYGQASSGALTLNVTPNGSGSFYAVIADLYDDTGGFNFSFNTVATGKGIEPLVTSTVSRVDTIPDNTSTAATVAVNGSVTGTIDSSGDVDWYGVNLSAGYIYTIQLRGSTSSNGTLYDPVIQGVYTSAGTLISGTYADDQNGRDSLLSFTPTTSGTYYIGADGWSSYTGTYLLSVQQSVADVPGTTATTASVPLGGSVSVTIDQAYDHDWYAVSLTGGNSYQFTLSGTGTNLYPTINGIYNASGTYVAGYTTATTSGTTASAVVTFSPTTSGTYYVDAYSYYAGSYTLAAVQTTTDIAANTSTAGRVTVNGSVTGTIESATDSDWYAVSLTAGTSYTINLQGNYSSNGTLGDPLITGVYDASGALVSNTYADDQVGSDSRLLFTPTSSGTYYIAADGYGSSTGTFRLSVSQTGPVDIAANTFTTGSVAVNSYANGTIDNTTDVDWYATSLTAGNAYTIRLQGSNSSNGTLSDPLISGIYDASGNAIANTYADDQDGRDSRLTFTPTSSGTYFIAADGYGSSTGTFRVSVESQGVADIAAATTTTGAVLVNSSVSSTIDVASDQDWFAVSLNAGVRYQVDLKGLASGSGTLTDPYLRGIYTSAGALISATADDDSGVGNDAQVFYTPSTAGTYYIAAGSYGSSVGTYNLAVTSLGSADIPADSSTLATVTPGGSVDGLVDLVGDRDWFTVPLAAGQTYTVDLQPKSNSTTPLNDPYLYGIYNSSGSLITGTSDDDAGAGYGAQVVYTPTSSGTYYISAGGYGSNVGNYALSVSNPVAGSGGSTPTPTPTTDLAANVSTLGAVTVGGTASSRIDVASDQDWFRVSLSAGRSYDISLGGAASNNGTLTDPYLRGVYDSTGALITNTTDDDGGYGNDSLVTFSPSTTGNYYVSAGGFSGATGTYNLSVTENTVPSSGGGTTPSPGTQGSWTVMVYVAGDNNLESFALSDVNEMEAARLPQNVRVAALVDRAPGYSTADGNWTDTRFGLISSDSNLNQISSSLTSWGERNTGDPATLTEFINASKLAAPADNYALVIWDHGGGISGVAWDDTSYSANLSLNEVSRAIASSNVTHFGVVGFDACLQGVLDQSYSLRTQADYLVVSEDLEPGDGWDYTNWLSVFQQGSTSAQQLATQAVNSYESFYQAQGNRSVTLSVIDTSQVGGVSSAWSSFAQSVVAGGSTAMQSLRTARSTALDFSSHTYVDVRSLMSNFIQVNGVASLDTAAQNVVNALSSAVVDTGGLSTASGLTVYMPTTSNSGYLNATEFAIAGLTGVNGFYTALWA